MDNNHKEKIPNVELINKISSLCYKIQNAGIGTVFFGYSGHVNQISVSIFMPEWTNEEISEISYGFYSYQSKKMLSIIEQLENVLKGEEDE